MSEESVESISLYESHKKIYPKYQPGFFRSLRWWVLWFLLGMYFLFPFLRWDRGPDGPGQAVLFDLPTRKFYIFDIVIWPQDVILLTVLLFAMTMGLFFMTTLAGRVFCGYICFQTVWTDLFLYVEKLVEGDRNRRLKLDRAPWTGRKLLLKLIKHAIWLLIGLLTGLAFVAYFMDVFELMGALLTGSAPFAAWFTILFLASTTYVMAGLAREQVCIYMCPYARFQGAMFDSDTLIVVYDEGRGEPRLSSRKERARKGAGDCIDCNECVRVCPTGIDIRDGQQYQCITCAACIDACDSVMDRLAKPRGLVRYSSQRAMDGLATRLIRTRVLVYGALLVAGLAAIGIYLGEREPLEMSVIRHRKPIYIQLSDGGVQNNYTLRVLNISTSPQRYALWVEGLPGAHLEVEAGATPDPEGRPQLTLGAGEVIPYTLYLRQPEAHLAPGSVEVTFHLRALDPKGGERQYRSSFLRP